MANDCAAFPDDNYWLTSMYLMAEVCAELDDVKAAETLYRLMSPFRGRMILVGNGALVLDPVATSLGRLAMCIGQASDAADLFRQAISQAGEWRAPAMRARALLGLSQALGDIDPAAAQASREECRALATELNLLRLIAALPAPFGEGETNRQRAIAGLSARELEVLALVAAGQSNQAIADSLVLSLNTVIRHVSNIYRKIDVSNRSEATSWALNHDVRPR
jgi:DNA-binding CsgD family transcriptional regulator